MNRPPYDPDPRYVAGPEPIVREPSRWPLFVAVLIVVASVVFVAQVAASRGEPGRVSEDTPALPGTPHAGDAGERRDGGRGTYAMSPVSPGVPLESPVPTGVLPDTASAVQGKASWYCGGGSACTRGYPPGQLVAAAGPALRVGDWRGRIVKVCNAGGDRRTLCVRVQLIDWCACPRRVIDLYRAAFSRLASPSRGVLRVSVTWGGSTVVLPPTDTR